MNLLTSLFQSGIEQGAPIILVALGEIICERSGVLNLGLEGMMLVGALFGFMGTYYTDSLLLGCLAGMLAGTALSLIHGFLTINLRANQIVSGLALVVFGGGLSAFIGDKTSPVKMTMAVVKDSFVQFHFPVLFKIPVLGPILFDQNLLVYLAYILILVVWFVLGRTRLGLNIRSVGENPACAEVMGVSVKATRYLCVLVGGAFAGLGGAYLSLALTPGWKEQMTGGRGWVAIAIVIFGGWKAGRTALGAILFGTLYALDTTIQARGTLIPTQFLQMLPYLLTIIFLVVARLRVQKGAMAAPEALGKPYFRESKE